MDNERPFLPMSKNEKDTLELIHVLLTLKKHKAQESFNMHYYPQPEHLENLDYSTHFQC